MVNLGEGLVKQGIEKGQNESRFESINSLMKNLNISMQEAMRLLSIPENDYNFYDEMMREKQLEPLSILFNLDMKPEEIIAKLKNEHDIDLHDETKKEVVKMCSLRDELILQGNEIGRNRDRIESIQSLMTNLQVSMHKAMRLLNIPESDYSIFEEMMAEKLN